MIKTAIIIPMAQQNFVYQSANLLMLTCISKHTYLIFSNTDSNLHIKNKNRTYKPYQSKILQDIQNYTKEERKRIAEKRH